MAKPQLTPYVDFIPVNFNEAHLQYRKLMFRHKDIRDAMKDSGQSIGDLMTNVFTGWPYLLRYGLRHQDLEVTLDKASDFMDTWVKQPDSKTQETRTLDHLGKKILEAINLSGFIKIEAENPIVKDADSDGDADEDAEKND